MKYKCVRLHKSGAQLEQKLLTETEKDNWGYVRNCCTALVFTQGTFGSRAPNYRQRGLVGKGCQEVGICQKCADKKNVCFNQLPIKVRM